MGLSWSFSCGLDLPLFWSWDSLVTSVSVSSEHEGPVSTVSISPDNLRVLCTTSTGNLGYLDIQSRNYSTLMRSHTNSILAFSVERLRKQMATVSQDNTIRIWDLVSMQQVLEAPFLSEERYS